MIDPSNRSIVLGKPAILSAKKVFGISALRGDGISGFLRPLGQAHVIEKTICCGTPLWILPVITRLNPSGQRRAKGMFNPKTWSVDGIIDRWRIEIPEQISIFPKNRSSRIETVSVATRPHMTCEIRGTFEITKSEAIFQRDPMPYIEPINEPGIDIVFLTILEGSTLNFVDIVSIIDSKNIFSPKPIFYRGLNNISVIRDPSSGSGDEGLALDCSDRKIRFSNLIGTDQIISHAERDLR